MSWASLHRESEESAVAAHEALRRGERARARELFAQAATAEMRAFESTGPDKLRTLGVTGVSAVALWYKAGQLDEAEQFAHRAAAQVGMPAFAMAELRELLQAIWNERAQQEAGRGRRAANGAVRRRLGPVMSERVMRRRPPLWLIRVMSCVLAGIIRLARVSPRLGQGAAVATLILARLIGGAALTDCASWNAKARVERPGRAS
jgi:hypothetical protein